MPRFAFFLVGKKGFYSLDSFIKIFGAERLAYVIAARDKGISSDYFSEIKYLCAETGIQFYERKKTPRVGLKQAEYFFAIGWKWMIKNNANLIVFHDSLLPKYRGFTPLVNMLIRGETVIGVTALWADEAYDRGPIVAQKSTGISYPIRIEHAIDRVIPIYAKLVTEIADRLVRGLGLPSSDQDEKRATYSIWREENDYHIDWSQDSVSIQRFVDSVGYPYKGAVSSLNGALVRILDTEVVEDVVIENRIQNLGKVIFVSNQCPIIICGSGLLKLRRIVADTDQSVISLIPFRSRFGGSQ